MFNSEVILQGEIRCQSLSWVVRLNIGFAGCMGITHTTNLTTNISAILLLPISFIWGNFLLPLENFLSSPALCGHWADYCCCSIGCEIIPDVNVNKEKFNFKVKLQESEDIEICCSCVSKKFISSEEYLLNSLQSYLFSNGWIPLFVFWS